jgi:hypothetical protein
VSDASGPVEANVTAYAVSASALSINADDPGGLSNALLPIATSTTDGAGNFTLNAVPTDALTPLEDGTGTFDVILEVTTSDSVTYQSEPMDIEVPSSSSDSPTPTACQPGGATTIEDAEAAGGCPASPGTSTSSGSTVSWSVSTSASDGLTLCGCNSTAPTTLPAAASDTWDLSPEMYASDDSTPYLQANGNPLSDDDQIVVADGTSTTPSDAQAEEQLMGPTTGAAPLANKSAMDCIPSGFLKKAKRTFIRLATVQIQGAGKGKPNLLGTTYSFGGGKSDLSAVTQSQVTNTVTGEPVDVNMVQDDSEGLTVYDNFGSINSWDNSQSQKGAYPKPYDSNGDEVGLYEVGVIPVFDHAKCWSATAGNADVNYYTSDTSFNTFGPPGQNGQGWIQGYTPPPLPNNATFYDLEELLGDLHRVKWQCGNVPPYGVCSDSVSDVVRTIIGGINGSKPATQQGLWETYATASRQQVADGAVPGTVNADKPHWSWSSPIQVKTCPNGLPFSPGSNESGNSTTSMISGTEQTVTLGSINQIGFSSDADGFGVDYSSTALQWGSTVSTSFYDQSGSSTWIGWQWKFGQASNETVYGCPWTGFDLPGAGTTANHQVTDTWNPNAAPLAAGTAPAPGTGNWDFSVEQT